MTRAPQIVHDVLRTPGLPLEDTARQVMEARLGKDFSQVRVHTDQQAADSAGAVGANAYTVGDHIAFAPGQYRPGSAAGDRLLAHELTHVVQHRGALPPSDLEIGAEHHGTEYQADAVSRGTECGHIAAHRPVVARQVASTWGSAYGGKEPGNYQAVKKGIDPLTPSSQPVAGRKYTGTRVGVVVAPAAAVRSKPGAEGKHKFLLPPGRKVLVGPAENGFLQLRALPDLKKAKGWIEESAVDVQGLPPVTERELTLIDPKWKEKAVGNAPKSMGEADVTAKVLSYLDKMNEAFDLLQIDVIETRAVFVANALVESWALSRFTEAQSRPQAFADDPTKLGTDRAFFELQYPKSRPVRKEINPTEETDPKKNRWDFRGRGAVQVTGRGNYLQTIAVLDRAAEQYRAEGDTAAADRCQAAVDAIKADPREAARPEHAFLFSAAFFKAKHGDRTGKDYSFMGTVQPEKVQKDAFLERALKVFGDTADWI
ncbi:eCIS core domain-containing protein [Allokutzneria multivorans]|uniref:eCIS core domain-containing protein n=1 Tax=Allokutzneria multivorans TaxID=1142134 RepID=UPI0031F0AA1A